MPFPPIVSHRALRWRLGAAGFLLFAGLCALTPAQAQPGPGRAIDREAILDRTMAEMTEQVELSAEQTAQIRLLLEERFERMLEMRPADRNRDRQAMQARRAQRSELQEALDRQIEALLTEAQIPRYRAFQANRQDQRLGRTGGRPGN